MLAIPPDDQQDRLQELRDLDILDTAPEEDFDDVVQLASRICGMPISLISLVDEDRQWFKARKGMNDTSTPLEQAICAHAILEDDYLEIGDTLTDPRTRDNPLVTADDALRFYAGAVLRTSNGHAVGTLCVLDKQPNSLTDLQRETLRVLAKQVMAQLELRRVVSEADLLRREVDHRVKNSLQSVAALTRIQARTATHPETREALNLTGRRIDTVALLHEHLYAPRAQGRIAMEDFLPRVANLLQQAAPANILLTTDVAPFTLSSARAAAVGVVLNEFASNAFKHAFTDGQKGTIAFRLQTQDDGGALLTCSDNGRGIEDADTAKGGLGFTIMEASAQQLGGRAERHSDAGGTTIQLTIAPEPAA
ncbi:sensor histidine kinase [Pseudooceanicola onchidii]|uniref:sensor histidine kinase n=1 Tax=Pseudooceanicola onchidii TaxID=2562279 RepID=UPI0010AB34EA|nr:histidine kinase dimerization/phosphoacceptor domain -containing protein [Pseudooceanicola onchidii]